MMDWWKCEHGSIGDGPADVMDRALREIENEYLEHAGRPPSQGELGNLIEFCTTGCLRPVCGDPRWPFSKSTSSDADTPRAASRGDQGAMRCETPPGKLANIDPGTGEHYDAPAEA